MKPRGSDGFTLIEMLVVLVLISISVGVVYPSLFNLRDRFDGIIDAAGAEREQKRESFTRFVTDGLAMSGYSSAGQPATAAPGSGTGEGDVSPATPGENAASQGNNGSRGSEASPSDGASPGTTNPAAPGAGPGQGSGPSGSGGFNNNRPFPSVPPPPPSRRRGPSDAII